MTIPLGDSVTSLIDQIDNEATRNLVRSACHLAVLEASDYIARELWVLDMGMASNVVRCIGRENPPSNVVQLDEKRK